MMQGRITAAFAFGCPGDNASTRQSNVEFRKLSMSVLQQVAFMHSCAFTCLVNRCGCQGHHGHREWSYSFGILYAQGKC